MNTKHTARLVGFAVVLVLAIIGGFLEGVKNPKTETATPTARLVSAARPVPLAEETLTRTQRELLALGLDPKNGFEVVATSDKTKRGGVK